MKNELLKNFNFDCERCFNTGLFLSSENQFAACPISHGKPNDASLILRRATENLFIQQIWINPFVFDLARILTKYTTDEPCPRALLFDYLFDASDALELNDSKNLRKFHGYIEELRTIWLLPVGSRKAEPSGYWMITDFQDCAAWLESSIAAPKTQLATLWRCAKYNFPMLAGQREFEFMNSIETEVKTDVN